MYCFCKQRGGVPQPLAREYLQTPSRVGALNVPRAATVAALLVLSLRATAQFPPQPGETLPGFKPGQTYQSSPVDNVNLYSGDLNLAIPLGPSYSLSSGLTWQLQAHYSAKLWTMETIPCSGQPDPTCFKPPSIGRAYASGYPTLGLGWTLHLGVVSTPPPPLSAMYYTPDGAGHEINRSGGPTAQDTNFDVRQQGAYWVIYKPDGTQYWHGHLFTPPNPAYTPPTLPNTFDLSSRESPGDKYGLTYIKDRFGNTVLEVFYKDAPEQWEIDHIVLNGDATNRTIRFTWSTYTGGDGLRWPVVSNIQFPVLTNPATTLNAVFTRLPSMPIRRGDFDAGHRSDCVDGGPANPDLPFLGSISQSTETYSFNYIRSDDQNFQNLAPGVLKHMVLPTGGAIDYNYNRSTVSLPCIGSACGNPETNLASSFDVEQFAGGFDPCEDAAYQAAYVDLTPAVATRTESDATTSYSSLTTYARDAVANKNYTSDPYPSPHRVARRVVVTRPTGNGGTLSTKYIFRNGYEVSRRYYADTNVAAAPVRSEEACYERTGNYGTLPATLCGVMEKDPSTQVVLIGDDFAVDFFRRSRSLTWYGQNPSPGGDCFAPGADAKLPCAQRSSSGYDANAREYQTTTIAPNAYLYSMYGFARRTTTTLWTPNLIAWILKLVDTRTVSDSGTDLLVPTSSTSTFRHSSTNGFLKDATISDATYGSLKRSYVDANDAPVMDTYGNATQEQISGTGFISGTVFTTTRGFGISSLLNSRRNGLDGNWKSFDVDRDPAAGLISVSRDPNATLTTYGYDSLSRLTSVTPTGEATSTISYATDNRKVTVDRTGSDDSTHESYTYDGFGRAIREIRQMPSSFAVRKRTFNEAGLLATESEWDSCTSETGDCTTKDPPHTTFSAFDPFGRATVITRPDSTVTTISYTDSFKVGSNVYNYGHSDTLESATVSVSGASATTTRRRDVLGRLIEVVEPHIDGDTSGDKTRYRYNVLDKLAKVEHLNAAESTVTQSRTFTYDALGLLRSEDHPEKGTTQYSGFDALGNPAGRSEGGTSYSYTYDPAGRLLGVSAGSTAFIRNCYDGLYWSKDAAACQTTALVGKPRGKLTDRVGFNPGASLNRPLVDHLTYDDAAGRLTKMSLIVRDLDTSWNDVTHLTQALAYTTLGQVKTHDHAYRDSGTPQDAPDRFRVTTSYSHGYPTSVTAKGQTVISSTTYHPYGGVKDYTLGNGIVVTEGLASTKMPRVDSISTTGATVNFSTGTYNYDGAGNVVSNGTSPTWSTFFYDTRSRLTSSSVYDLGSSKTDGVTYDRFGNIISRVQDGGTIGLDTSAATNRLCAQLAGLCSTVFDTRGNLTSFGGKTYGYDDLSRETWFQLGSTLEKYLYDGRNERVTRIVPTASLPQPPAGLKLFTIAPCRVLDTRDAAGPYGGPRIPVNGSRAFIAWGRCAIPTTAAALAANITSVVATGQGSFRAYPTASIHPVITSNALKAGTTRATQAMIGLDSAGSFSIEADQATADALVDGSGYFAPEPPPTPPSGDTYLFTLRDPQNRLSAEYSATAPNSAASYTPGTDQVYFGNRLVASYSPTRVPSPWLYYVTDHLGSPRIVTDQGANTVGRHTYRPFGLPASDEAAPQGAAFAGMEKDAASARYFDHARFYNTPILRFHSPDKLLGRREDPQSWNRYSYARNSPVSFADSTGLEVELAGCAANDAKECAAQLGVVKESVGTAAAAYLRADAQGKLQIAGISTKAFGALSNQAAVMSALIGKAETYRFSGYFMEGPSLFPQYDNSYNPQNKTIFLNLNSYPMNLGGVSVSAAEAFVHESAHALWQAFPGIGTAVGSKTNPGWASGWPGPNEGFATAIENQWRRDVGLEKLREFYSRRGDYVDPVSTLRIVLP